MGTRLVVVGGVAAGATAAARARRIDEAAQISLIEKGPFISYANCGLPYFIAGDIKERSSLLLQTPEGFASRYNVTALVNTEVVEIDRLQRRVRSVGPLGEQWHAYDKLILAQGGLPILPSVPGAQVPGAQAPHVFTLWSVPDVDRMHAFLQTEKPATAVVVGGGFIGLEMAEALTKRGVHTTVVEQMPTLMRTMDTAFALQVAHTLEQNNVTVKTGVGLVSVNADATVSLSDGQSVPADLVLFSVGVRPTLGLARSAGLTLGPSGGLLVDAHLRTSDENIWAAGDMVEVEQRVSGRRMRVPLAGPANRQGRIAASNAMGLATRYNGALGTSVVKIFEATAAMTGLSERVARESGLDVGVASIHKEHHAGYYPGAKELSLTLLYERPSGKLLGAQAFGLEGVDKRIDVVATALHGAMTVHDLAELDLAYAPPYSSANDPLNLAAFVAQNDLSGFSPLISVEAFRAELAGTHKPLVIDVRSPREFAAGHLEEAVNIPVDTMRASLESLPRDRRIIVQCRSGFRGHLALRILRANGFRDVANVTGGWLSLKT